MDNGLDLWRHGFELVITSALFLFGIVHNYLYL